jgi:bifunctional non-homologous end joining protein LigD
MTTTHLEVGQHTLELKHLDKPFFPKAGLTKGDVVDYYRRIADTMLPHLQQRPLNLFRAPEGLGGDTFFQQNRPDYFPDWIEGVSLDQGNGTTTHVLCASVEALVYLANQACITPHVWLSRVQNLNSPDRLIFDLDPPDDDFQPVRDAARKVRDLFCRVGLTPFVQTTGSRGLHVVAPLDTKADFDTTRNLAQDLAETLAQKYPDQLTTAQYKDQRQGRLYLDTKRNAYGQTAVAPYAIRLKPGAPVATPLEWDELSHGDLHAQSYTVENIFRRLGQKEDPWRSMAESAGSVANARKQLEQF